MNIRNLLLIGLLPMVLCAGCLRAENRTVVVSVPQMTTADCAQIIQEALLGVDGVRSAYPDLEAKTIAVSFQAAKLAIKNVEFAIADAGFEANGIPANPSAQAALPAECRPSQ